MVKHLRDKTASSPRHVLVAATGIVVAFATFAARSHAATTIQELPDPTRPPAVISTSKEAAGAAAGGPVLQSVLVSPARKIAIIDGQTVAVGDKVGDAYVVRIMEDEVTLKSGAVVSKLKLFPDVEKHMSSARGNAGLEKQIK